MIKVFLQSSNETLAFLLFITELIKSSSCILNESEYLSKKKLRCFGFDSVDLEYSLRAKKHGIPFIKSDKRYLYHELGNNADKQGFFITPNYPIWRYKYQFVNTIKIIIRYPTDPLLFRLVARRAYYFLRIIILELPIKMLNR